MALLFSIEIIWQTISILSILSILHHIAPYWYHGQSNCDMFISNHSAYIKNRSRILSAWNKAASLGYGCEDDAQICISCISIYTHIELLCSKQQYTIPLASHLGVNLSSLDLSGKINVGYLYFIHCHWNYVKSEGALHFQGCTFMLEAYLDLRTTLSYKMFNWGHEMQMGLWFAPDSYFQPAMFSGWMP